MRAPESLDELISKRAKEFAEQITRVANLADKEEEIRIATEKQLAFIQQEAGITLEGKHEFTVASGRVDSVYQRVIIEYKNPASPAACIGPKADSPGAKKVVEQIRKRFYDMRSEHGHALNSLFGVGLDGKHFIFIRFRDEKWQIQDPVAVDRHSTARFLWALFNLGEKGKPFSPEYLAQDFGAGEGSVATDGIRALYGAIVETDHPKAQTFFNQWKILFSEVCGYDVDNPSEKIKKLAQFYGVPHRGLKPAELLFAVHSYYAIFMKLLASEIVAFFHKLPTPHEKMMRAGTSNQLKREMEDLEKGSIFRHLNITNFLEGDLFAWYINVWSEPIEKLVRNIVARIDNYNPGTLSEDPAGSRDLLKKLYQQLFPKSVRHDLGEYYSPDWLADHVLNELGYVGDPDKRLLDPGCGSGTFLVMAIKRIRAWYDQNRENIRYDETELCRKILNNVIGFDLNPLAVMAARTNYLIAIRDLISYADRIEIPIYLCDSIMTPSEYGGLFSLGLGKAKELKTAAATFYIPSEIAARREDIAKYAEQLENGVQNGYSPEEFLERCRDDGLVVSEEVLHTDLYDELVKLDKANKNGVWARIIKNAFAPLFIGKVDYVVGNPPWVNWESLPEEYRNSLKPLWQEYGLFTLSGSAGRLGGGKKDLSMLFVYVSVDNYLSEGGKLGFVITQTVFKTKGAGDGFRRLKFERKGKTTFLTPLIVHDLSPMQVFEGATNRTSVFVCQKSSEEFSYPVPYYLWRGQSRISQEENVDDLYEKIERLTLAAMPVEQRKPTSPWLTVPKESIRGVQKVLGQSFYKAFEGVNTGGLNGCYWIRILQKFSNGDLLIENLYDTGKIKVEHVQCRIEPERIFPLLRGRDVLRWQAEPSVSIVLAQEPETRRGFPEAEMKRKYPKTYSYLKNFESQLHKRASSSVRRLMDTGPFYSMFAVGPYTMATWKVLWPEIGHTVRAGVCGPQTVEAEKPALPDHTIVAVSCRSRNEAHFICGLLNSSPAQLAARGYIVLHPSPHILENIAIPQYESGHDAHKTMAKLSDQCHSAKTKGNEEKIDGLETLIDEAAAEIWKITKTELRAIQNALQEMERPVRCDLSNEGSLLEDLENYDEEQ